MVVNKS